MLIGNRIYDLVNYMTSEMTLKVNGVIIVIYRCTLSVIKLPTSKLHEKERISGWKLTHSALCFRLRMTD